MCDVAFLPIHELTDKELKVFLTMCRFSDGEQVQINQSEIVEYTGYGRTTVYRAIESLFEKNMVSIVRTKRNLGKYYFNNYVIHHVSNHVSLAKHGEQNEGQPRFTGETSTASHSYSTSNTTESTSNKQIELNTTYSIVFASENEEKEMRYQEDDEVQGFGLLEDDIKKEQPKASKRTSKTRHLRPEEEWTALDVAGEFKKRVMDRIPDAMNVVNTLKLSKILGKNRKDFNLTPLIELEVMDLFLNDWWFKNKAHKEPHYITGRFLKFFTSHLNKALVNLGYQGIEQSKDVLEVTERSEVIYASDGTEFDNSVPGRVELKEYEEGLVNGSTQRNNQN